VGLRGVKGDRVQLSCHLTVTCWVIDRSSTGAVSPREPAGACHGQSSPLPLPSSKVYPCDILSSPNPQKGVEQADSMGIMVLTAGCLCETNLSPAFVRRQVTCLLPLSGDRLPWCETNLSPAYVSFPPLLFEHFTPFTQQ
jgi:hypothetical protein